VTATLTPEATPARKRSLALKIGLGVVIAGIAAMWVYAFVFAPRKGVYRLDSAQWRREAQQICTRAVAQRVALTDTSAGFIEHPTNEQMLQRATVVDQATDIIEQMLDDVVALPTESDRDHQLVIVWEGFYRQLITDRREYTDRLRRYDDQPFREDVIKGGPVSDVLTDFTSGNDIKACAPPETMRHSPSTCRRSTLAGTPAATEKSGMSQVTTELAPTTTWRPIVTPGSTTDPVPNQEPSPISTRRSGIVWREIGRSRSS
jgi:hypothetical protein